MRRSLKFGRTKTVTVARSVGVLHKDIINEIVKAYNETTKLYQA